MTYFFFIFFFTKFSHFDLNIYVTDKSRSFFPTLLIKNEMSDMLFVLFVFGRKSLESGGLLLV